jgi:hypothetical protein
MSKQEPTGTEKLELSSLLNSLMDVLAGKDGAARMKARKALVALGKPAVASLIRALQNSRSDQLRWEAAKALGTIGDSRAIPALMKALEDRDSDVRWVAAEALKKFRKAAWPPLLRALVKTGADSSLLRQGAHHVLRKQRDARLNDLLAVLVWCNRNALSHECHCEVLPKQSRWRLAAGYAISPNSHRDCFAPLAMTSSLRHPHIVKER